MVIIVRVRQANKSISIGSKKTKKKKTKKSKRLIKRGGFLCTCSNKYFTNRSCNSFIFISYRVICFLHLFALNFFSSILIMISNYKFNN